MMSIRYSIDLSFQWLTHPLPQVVLDSVFKYGPGLEVE